MKKLVFLSFNLLISAPTLCMETANQWEARLAAAKQELATAQYAQLRAAQELHQHERNLENINTALRALAESIRNYATLDTAQTPLLDLVNESQEIKNRYDNIDQQLAQDPELLGALRKLRKQYGPKVELLVAKALANYKNALVENPGFFLVEIEKLNIAPQRFDTPIAFQERKNLVGMFITQYKLVENNENIDPSVRRELKDVLMEASIPTHPRFFAQAIDLFTEAHAENFNPQERAEALNRLSNYIKMYTQKVKDNPYLKLRVKQTIKEALTRAYDSFTQN